MFRLTIYLVDWTNIYFKQLFFLNVIIYLDKFSSKNSIKKISMK